MAARGLSRSVPIHYIGSEVVGRGAQPIPYNLTTRPMPLLVPERQFAAVQKYACNQVISGRSTDAAGTPAPDPDEKLPKC